MLPRTGWVDHQAPQWAATHKAANAYDHALSTTVDQAPRDLAQPFSTWTCASLATYLPTTQGQAAVSAETVRRHVQALDYAVVRYYSGGRND